MAVNDRTTQNTPPQQPGAQPQQQQQQQQRPAQQHAGFSSINQQFQRGGSIDNIETRSAEALKALDEAVREARESQRLDERPLELTRFDRDTNRVGMASILVTRRQVIQGQASVAVYVLMLDNPEVRLRPRITQFGAQTVETKTLAQDVFSESYWGKITDFMSRKLGAQPNQLVVAQAGAQLVPHTFDFSDKLAVEKLLIGAANRCDDVLASIHGEQPFNVASIRAENERFTARFDISDEPRSSNTGLPIRSDVVVHMNLSNNAKSTAQDDFYESDTELNSVSGYVNLEYSPPETIAGYNPQYYPGQPMPTQLFTPTFVITSVNQADWIRMRTMELYLLAISNAYRVTAGNSWVRVFAPRVGVKGIDPRDIGALGYLTQEGKMIPTKGEAFSQQDFEDLLTLLVKPLPTFLIDVDPLGENSSIENYFIDAAFANANQQAAIDKIIGAANNLTGGRFSKYFEGGNLFDPYGQPIHLGYYEDQEGQVRDIRDLDVLAMLNYTEGNLQEFTTWYRTVCDTSMPPEFYSAQRENFEKQFLGKTVRITGRAYRLAINPKFIMALEAAVTEAGVVVNYEDVSSVFGAQRFVGNSMVNQYTVSGAARITQPGYGQGPATYQSGPMTGGQGRYYG